MIPQVEVYVEESGRGGDVSGDVGVCWVEGVRMWGDFLFGQEVVVMRCV